jgi:hypothetical protein
MKLLSLSLAVYYCSSSSSSIATAAETITTTSTSDTHPDPNDESYDGMIYIGRLDPHDGSRVGHHADNSIRYIFGTSFDETHKYIEMADLLHDHHGPDVLNDLPQQHKTREQVIHEMRHKPVDQQGPKPFGHVDVNPLDGGVVPPQVVKVDPFFIDVNLVTNKEYGKFVRATLYETEAEHYGWSFVLASFLPKADLLTEAERDPEAEHWILQI